MKIHHRHAFFYILVVFICFSCNKTEPKKESPEEIDNPKLRQELGGEPDETTAIVHGSFFSDKKNCKSGFGICDLTFPNPTAGYPDSSTNNPNNKTYQAIFTLGTSVDSLQIEFDQEIPHAENYLTVGKQDTITNVLGHEYIIPVIGKYQFIKHSNSKYGRVEIKVIKGKPKSIYRVKPGKDTTKGH